MAVVLHEIVEIALGEAAAGLAQVDLRVLLNKISLYFLSCKDYFGIF